MVPMAADTNSISTTALVLIAAVPVVAGAVLTALFALLAQKRIDQRDHERWLREKRYGLAMSLIGALSEYRRAVMPTEPNTWDVPAYTASMDTVLRRADSLYAVLSTNDSNRFRGLLVKFILASRDTLRENMDAAETSARWADVTFAYSDIDDFVRELLVGPEKPVEPTEPRHV